ncbi:MAG: hypothetical protein KAS93_06240 [Gammaproteobacteria bacterium]|nr:hypothetical protein [Gammaproteobacteria bacterium]
MNDEDKIVDSIEHSESIDDEEKRKFLLTDESYQKLRDLQQRIYEATELSPSLRKLINALITDESLENLRSNLMKKLEV